MAKHKSEIIASIKRKLSQLKEELNSNSQIVRDMQRRQEVLKKEIAIKEAMLIQKCPERLTVSDHALVRYMERAQGIDIEGVRNEILNTIGGAIDIGSVDFNGFVIRENMIVTYKGGDQ